MAFTFEDAQNKLSSLLKDPNTDASDMFPATQRKKELNRGELQFAKDTLLLREKATGTISGGQISFPSDMLEIYVLIVGNSVIGKEREISIKDYERWYNFSGSTPIYYISEESGTRYIKFLGSANGSTYSLYYYKKPTTELSASADVSLFPEEFRDGPIYYAAAELLQQTGKHEQSDKYRLVYSKIVRDAQMYAEKLYVDKSYANPDVNAIEAGTTDLQGGGYDYGG